MTYIARCFTCYEPVSEGVAYCVACRQIDAINRQTKQANDLAEQNAERMAQQASRQERLESDRIWELRQLEEYRQREKLLDLIPGYRQQQALELAEQMRLEKEEEAEYKRISEEWDRFYATPEGQAYKHKQDLDNARSRVHEHSFGVFLTYGVGLVSFFLVLRLFATGHPVFGTMALFIAVLGVFGLYNKYMDSFPAYSYNHKEVKRLENKP